MTTLYYAATYPNTLHSQTGSQGGRNVLVFATRRERDEFVADYPGYPVRLGVDGTRVTLPEAVADGYADLTEHERAIAPRVNAIARDFYRTSSLGRFDALHLVTDRELDDYSGDWAGDSTPLGGWYSSV